MYTGDKCKKCERVRVELINGKRICEKCYWNQDTNQYDRSIDDELKEQRELGYLESWSFLDEDN